MGMKTTVLTAMAAVCLSLVAGCGGGGGGAATGGGGTSPAQALRNIANHGGGVGGSPAAAGGTVSARVSEETTQEGLAGFGVSVNGADGAVIASGVTDSTGDVAFAHLSAQPISVTFVDPVTNEVTCFCGSAQSPLPSLVAITASRGPSFDVTLTNLTAGTDVQLELNGVPVAAKDNVTATEQFTFSAPLNAGTAGVFGTAALVGKDKPWLLVAKSFENTTATTVDTANMLAASYLADSDGSAYEATPTPLTLDFTAGTATTGGGRSAGLCTVGTVTGAISVGLLQFGLVPTLAGIPLVTAEMTNSFGTWTTAKALVDTANLQGSLLAPPLASSVNYSIQYPVFPAGFTAGAYTKDVRTAQLALGSSTELLALLNQIGTGGRGTPDAATIQNLLGSLVLLTRRVTQSAPANVNVAFGTLPSLKPAKAYTTMNLGTVGGQPFPGTAALLTAQIDANTCFTSVGVAVGASVEFSALAASSGTLAITNIWIGAASVNGALSTSPSGYTFAGIPRTGLVTLSGTGDTGTTGTPIAVSLAISTGDLTLNITSPSGTPSFALATDSIAWTGGGLEGRDGLYFVTLAADVATNGPSWTVIVPSTAVTAIGIQNYAFRIPQLPQSAPFAAAAITAAATQLTVTVLYLDVDAAGVNPISFTIDQLGASIDGTFLPDALATAKPITGIGFIQPAAVNPE
jgi:hypothetical protein